MFAHRWQLVAGAAALVLAVPLAAAATAPAPSAGEAKPERTITSKGIEPKDGLFFAKGKVKPGYEQRFATLQRTLKKEKSWSSVRRFKTTDASRYREEIHELIRPGIVCYRVTIKGNHRFRTSHSPRVCIRTFQD